MNILLKPFMLTLLQISIEVNSGSVGRIAEQIGQTVIANSWNSFITYARNNQPSKSNVIKIGTKWDVYIHGLQTRFLDNHGFASVRATKKLIREIQTLKPDIIHLHHLHGYFINIETLFNFLASASIPIVWTQHDCWSFTGHCAYFDFVGCEKWKKECFRCPQKKAYPASALLDRSEVNFRSKKALFTSVQQMTIVPVSQWLGNLIKESFLSEYPIKVIQNGVDLNVFTPCSSRSLINKQFNVDGKFIILGVASTWDQRKGLEDFIKLHEIINEEYQIVLVGLTGRQIKKLPKNIIGINRTENVQQLAELYAAADVFVNPTWEDTFPTTNLEALACGTPVITYRTGGSVESVSENTGFIVEKGDINGLFSAIEQLRQKDKAIYTLACRERAVKFYNKEDRFKEYLQLYEELLLKNTRNNC